MLAIEGAPLFAMSLASYALYTILVFGGLALASWLFVQFYVGLLTTSTKFTKLRKVLRFRLEKTRTGRRLAQTTKVLDEASNWTPKETFADTYSSSRPFRVNEDSSSGDIILGILSDKLITAPRDSSPVVLIGGTGSGKTTGIILPTLLTYDAGPVIVTSVKADLMQLSIGHRASLGPVAVFAPGTKLPPELEKYRMHWSPLVGAGTWEGALEMARALVQGAQRKHSSDGEFWGTQAYMLLAPILYAMAINKSNMRNVIRVVSRFSEKDIRQEVLGLVVELDNADAYDMIQGVAAQPDATRGSTVATATAALVAYQSPSLSEIPASAPMLNPDFLLRDVGDYADASKTVPTIYIVAPQRKQELLRPIFTALLSDLVGTALDSSYQYPNGQLPRELLVLSDETGNIAVPGEFPQWASTARGSRVRILSVWQTMEQAIAAFGEEGAATLFSNAPTLALLPRIRSERTLRWAALIAGDTEVADESVSETTTVGPDGSQSSSASRSKSKSSRPLVQPGQLSSLQAGRVVLLIGEDRQAIRQTPYYENAKWLALSRVPLDGNNVAMPVAEAPLPANTPSIPQALRADPAASAAELQWVAPAEDGGGPISSYEILAFVVGVDGSKRRIGTHNVPARSLKYTITNLIDGQNYTFSIAATNARGTGAHSDLCPQVTPRSTPSATADITASVAASGVFVRWSPPASDGSSMPTEDSVDEFVQPKVFRKFRLTIRSFAEPNRVLATHEVDPRDAHTKGGFQATMPDTGVDLADVGVCVEASNDMGWGPASELVVVRRTKRRSLDEIVQARLAAAALEEQDAPSSSESLVLEDAFLGDFADLDEVLGTEFDAAPATPLADSLDDADVEEDDPFA